MKIKSIKYVIAYLLVWVLLLVYFWIGIRKDDALFFSLLMTTMLPIMTALMSYNVGKKDRTSIRIVTVIFSGVMFMLLTFLTFDLLNSLTFHHANYPEPLVAGMGAIVSLIFVAAGMIRGKGDCPPPDKIQKVLDKAGTFRYNDTCRWKNGNNMAHWSRGQDVALSRRNPGFDSLMRYQVMTLYEMN